MDYAIAHACSLPLPRHFASCRQDISIENHHHIEVRQQTAPDGQVLPEWLTWSPVRIPHCKTDNSMRLP